MGWKTRAGKYEMGEARERSTELRWYIVTLSGKDNTDRVKAHDGDQARAIVVGRLQHAQRGLDFKEARKQIRSCRLEPGQAQKRGPKPGTPNPYFQRYPGELSTRLRRQRRIPDDAPMDPNRVR